MLRKNLLACGVLASILYVGIDVLAAILYSEYHSFRSRMISELMANGAPTERLVDPLFLLYDFLMMAFAVGVWMSSPQKRVRMISGLLFAYAVLGLLGPTYFEMNLRGSGHSNEDVAHIVLTGVIVLLILASVVIGASIHGRRFRLYSLMTLLVIVVFGALTAPAAQALAAGQPTPWLGLVERINIGAFLLWAAVLAISFWRIPQTTDPSATKSPRGGMPPSTLPAR